MSDPPPPETPEPSGGPPASEPESYYETPVWKRFYAFILGPALLAGAVLAVFTLTSVLTADESDPHELVQALTEGGEHRRWQAAFALTKYLQPSVREADAKILRESDDDYRRKLEAVRLQVPRLLDIWNDPRRGDPQVQRFLALAFGYLADPRLVPALAGALGSDDIELVHYALAAIASTADIASDEGRKIPQLGHETVNAVLAASRRSEADVRATAVYVLAVLGTPTALEQVAAALEDPAAAVAWNAAFGLARHGDGRGEAVIAEILDRGPLYRAVGPDPERQRDLFLNAVRSAGMVPTPRLAERLARIAESDSDLTARNAAKRLVEEIAAADPDEG